MNEEIARYLQSRYRPETVTLYKREINNFLQYTRQAERANYSAIMQYIGALREQSIGISRIQMALQAIKQYYHCLLQSGKRNDHPCRYITLKDKPGKGIQLQDLFTEQELELLSERKERFKIMEIRNRVLLSLLLCQGLTTGELTQLTVNDIDLEEGVIYIKGTTLTNSRTLGLKPKQIMLLHQYLRETRPKLLSRSKNKKPDNELILTWRGNSEKGEGIHYLISTCKKLFPERNLNPRTIRQSVITNLLKQGKDVRIVQEYAGHKSPDTTEKYKQSDTEQLQQAVNKHHPLADEALA